MREFIEALFEKENKIEFQYEDYEMSFFAGRFKVNGRIRVPFYSLQVMP